MKVTLRNVGMGHHKCMGILVALPPKNCPLLSVATERWEDAQASRACDSSPSTKGSWHDWLMSCRSLVGNHSCWEVRRAIALHTHWAESHSFLLSWESLRLEGRYDAPFGAQCSTGTYFQCIDQFWVSKETASHPVQKEAPLTSPTIALICGHDHKYLEGSWRGIVSF